MKLKRFNGTEIWEQGAIAVMALVLGAVAIPASAAGRPRILALPEEVIVRMEERFQEQLAALVSYRDVRRYSVSHALLGEGAYWIVEENFTAPDEKRFQVLERGGSGAVQRRVFSRLLEVERETSQKEVRPQLDLSRKNYEFKYLGFDTELNAYRFDATPRGENEYLLRGTIWVNAEDFAVTRIEGEPATRHSILIERVRFVHEFAKFGEFWFPVRHRSETKLRLFGTASLEIDYSGYQWQARHSDPDAEAGGTSGDRIGTQTNTLPHSVHPFLYNPEAKQNNPVTGGK